MSIYETDIWRLGIVKAPMAEVLTHGVQNVHWLHEEPEFKFLADPFGIFRDGKLYVFAEAYDYTDRHGRIEVLVFNESLELLDRRLVLEEPWHLSYPMLIEDKGEVYMLPEGYKSGKTILYKSINFPYQWEKVDNFSFLERAIDPTVLFYDNLWWMFYTPTGSGIDHQSTLSVAWAKELMGPWTPHSHNPVRITPFSARPGGSAVITDQGIILPTQNCTHTYGGGLSLLQITHLTPDHFEAKVIDEVAPDVSFGAYQQGIHTLSSAGPYTLIDAKKIVRSPIKRLILDGNYHFRKKLKGR